MKHVHSISLSNQPFNRCAMTSQPDPAMLQARSASYLESVGRKTDNGSGSSTVMPAVSVKNKHHDDEQTSIEDAEHTDRVNPQDTGPPSLLATASVISRWTYYWMTPFVKLARKGAVGLAVFFFSMFFVCSRVSGIQAVECR